MHSAIPLVSEHADELKQQLQRDHDGHKKPRLRMLYLLASGQAQTRQEVARLLGVHRNTIGRWLALYAAGGLATLLRTYSPRANRCPSRLQYLPASSGFSTARRALPRMRPCASGCDRRMEWRSSTRRSTPWCAPASRRSFKWPGPRTQNNPEASPAFRVSRPSPAGDPRRQCSPCPGV
jgi:hypothetical protein